MMDLKIIVPEFSSDHFGKPWFALGMNIIQLFYAGAVDGPEYFSRGARTAHYDLLPEANGQGQ